uniref:Uncharacterized protein n=1 Tax=Rhizophora mucronata TaxID=61149 RepID=A0A2P2NV56_RHIMU
MGPWSNKAKTNKGMYSNRLFHRTAKNN